MNPQLYTQPLSDYNLDQLASRDGLLQTIPTLSLDLDDKYIIQTLHNTIEESVKYYDDINIFNLKNKRLKNDQMLQGKHLQEHKLYRHQTPYIDNEIYVGVDAIKSYVTAQTPKSEVYPASDSDESKAFAKDLECYHHSHSEKFMIPQKLEGAVQDMESKYVGFLKLHWDPFYGKVGELIPEVIDPNHVIIDKNAKRGQNPRFICHVLKDTLEGLISKFPDKEEELLKLFTIKRKGARNMNAEIAYREVWFTWYKKNEPQEAVCWYVRNVVLNKSRNINWLYENEGENFLDNPMKPFIPFNIDNDGSHWIDKTSPVEQAIPMQEILNKVGRQIIDNIATANGFKAFDSKAITKDDVQNMTGDPNQSLVVKVAANKRLSDVIMQLPPQLISPESIALVNDARQTIKNILGTPDQFTGSDQDQTKTASEAQMIKNQASGRQDKLVRAVDYGMDLYFKLLTQMMTVWYTKKHYATVNGGDGAFDYIEMHKNKIETGMTVRVQVGTTLPFDKARQESVAQNAAELELIAPYDYYRLMHMDNPQKLFDNLVKWKTDPQSLALDNTNNQSDTEAIVDFAELMDGNKVEQRDDASQEYIEQMRKLMITDKFLKAKTGIQTKIIEFVKKAVESLALRTELDQMSAPPPPPPIPAPVQQTMPAPAPPMPGAMPGMPPGGAPMPPGMPGGIPPASPIQGIMQTPLGGQAPLGAMPPQAGAPPALNGQPQVSPVPGNLPPF